MKDFKLVILAPGADGTDVGEAWSSFQWIRGATEWADVTVLNQRRRGRASLVEQERPNMFTTSVANIGPGETISVQIEYQDIARLNLHNIYLRM